MHEVPRVLPALFDRSAPAFAQAAPIYAVTCRRRSIRGTSRLEIWAHALAIGQPLPALPLWLSDERAVSLELGPSYEETCRVLRIA